MTSTTPYSTLSALSPLDLSRRIDVLVADGLLSVADHRLTPTARGRKLLDSVLRALLV